MTRQKSEQTKKAHPGFMLAWEKRYNEIAENLTDRELLFFESPTGSGPLCQLAKQLRDIYNSMATSKVLFKKNAGKELLSTIDDLASKLFWISEVIEMETEERLG